MRTWKRKERRKKGSFHKLEYLLSRLKKNYKHQPNKRAAKIFYMQKDQFRIDSKVFFVPPAIDVQCTMVFSDLGKPLEKETLSYRFTSETKISRGQFQPNRRTIV